MPEPKQRELNNHAAIVLRVFEDRLTLNTSINLRQCHERNIKLLGNILKRSRQLTHRLRSITCGSIT